MGCLSCVGRGSWLVQAKGASIEQGAYPRLLFTKSGGRCLRVAKNLASCEAFMG
jgi:hypothetical protein